MFVSVLLLLHERANWRHAMLVTAGRQRCRDCNHTGHDVLYIQPTLHAIRMQLLLGDMSWPYGTNSSVIAVCMYNIVHGLESIDLQAYTLMRLQWAYSTDNYFYLPITLRR
jgi:hypothetical protein